MTRRDGKPPRLPSPSYGLADWIAFAVGVGPEALADAERAAGLAPGRLRAVLRGEGRLSLEEAPPLAEATGLAPAILAVAVLADLHPQVVEALRPAWSDRLSVNERTLLTAARRAATDGPPMELDRRDRISAAMIRGLRRADED